MIASPIPITISWPAGQLNTLAVIVSEPPPLLCEPIATFSAVNATTA